MSSIMVATCYLCAGICMVFTVGAVFLNDRPTAMVGLLTTLVFVWAPLWIPLLGAWATRTAAWIAGFVLYLILDPDSWGKDQKDV